MMKDNSVHVVYGEDPAEMVRLLFEMTSKSDKLSPADLISPNEIVVIKPNLFMPKESATGATTDPLIVEQIIVELKKLRVKKIIITEGSWLRMDTAQAYKVCGYEKIASKHGIDLVNLKEDKYTAVPVPLPFTKLKEIQIADTILKADKIINLPVLKGHSKVKMSCGMKNLMGVISEADKNRFHQIGLDQSIFELNTVIKTSVNICDAVVGDAFSEDGSSTVRFGKVFMSQDLFLFDSYAANCLGYDIKEIGYLKNYHEYLVTKDNPEIIEINKPVNFPDKMIDNYPKSFKSKVFSRKALCPRCSILIESVLGKGYGGSNQEFHLGMDSKQDSVNPFIQSVFIGNCSKRNSKPGPFVPGCPPTDNEVIRMINSFKKK